VLVGDATIGSVYLFRLNGARDGFAFSGGRPAAPPPRPCAQGAGARLGPRP